MGPGLQHPQTTADRPRVGDKPAVGAGMFGTTTFAGNVGEFRVPARKGLYLSTTNLSGVIQTAGRNS